MKDLAINGGKKTRTTPFPAQPGPSYEEGYISKIGEVLESRILSGYRGNASPAFWGGPWVQKFEKKIEDMFSIEYAVACNSATSGLWMACNAIGLQPGDEVIVTPWSMSCSATVPLLFGAIPVFADIDAKTYNLDPVDVEKKITKRTKAIIAVDLFGKVYDDEINKLADKYNLYVIEDAAQAIGAIGKKEDHHCYAGAMGHIGVFSFTQGKHLTAGEGGCCVTKDAALYKRLAMARNHFEAVENEHPFFLAHNNGVGLNLRMTEIQAAILCEELKRLPEYLKKRRKFAEQLYNMFAGVFPADVMPSGIEQYHAYYVLPFPLPEKYDAHDFAEKVRAELMPDEIRIDRGVPFSAGYIKPLYLFPVFQHKQHWAFKLMENTGHSGTYEEGTCPVAERLNENGLCITLLHGLDMSVADFMDVICAILKVVTSFDS